MVEEYQLEGTTVAYEPAGDGSPGSLGPDGRWSAVVLGEGDYRTRILVVRPEDPERFNGTVLLNWQNVSAGVENGAPRGGEVYRGYAWVGVSAQEVGICGLPGGMLQRGGLPTALPLIDHDGQRYGELRHPGDQGSFDMFSQAARAVGVERVRSSASGVDPMGGLDVRRVVATGGSQSAMRLVSYINAVHPLDGVVDGFLLSVWEGRAPSLLDGPISFGGLRTTIRSDVPVPVIVVNSEFEALGVHAVGTVDVGMIRVWEVAGAPHGVARGRGGGASASGWGVNPLSITPVYEAAIRRMHGWLCGAEGPAPAQPRIAIDDGPPPQVRRDPLGNTIGGIRLPEIEVPVAEYRGMSFGTGRAPLFGAARPFEPEVVRSRYPTRAVFVERWEAAVDRLVASGAALAEDAPAMKARAAEVVLPVD